MTDAQLRAFLLDQDVGWLAHELLQAAKTDALLRARLEVAAGGDPHHAFDDNGLRTLLEQAIDSEGGIDWREASSVLPGHEMTAAVVDRAPTITNDSATVQQNPVERLFAHRLHRDRRIDVT